MRNPGIVNLYNKLFLECGPQGWWPIKGRYHPGDYSYPKTTSQKFEICVGAIMTQNTAWKNVEKALLNLQGLRAMHPKTLLSLSDKELKPAIKPAGYFNQKAKKLRIFAEFFASLDGKTPARTELLALWGIGPETADSMLLYAYHVPTFVVDAYTRRLLISLKMIHEKADYNEIKSLFECSLPKDYKTYQEFHALIVQHAKINR